MTPTAAALLYLTAGLCCLVPLGLYAREYYARRSRTAEARHALRARAGVWALFAAACLTLAARRLAGGP